jgi:nicotinamide riboside kinase
VGIFKIGIIGPESTGKSTLANYLAHRYNGVLVPEYAREYMEKREQNTDYTYEDVKNIALLGIDSRSDDKSGRADANVILTIDKKTLCQS